MPKAPKMITPPKKEKNPQKNRNWVKPPNTMVKKGNSRSPQKLSYWTDVNNKPKLYTKKQLAYCNILMNLNFLLTKSLVLMDILKTLDEDTKIGTLIRQDYANFDASKSSIFNRFISLMAAVPDVTFGEFLTFISTNNNNNPKKIITLGQKTLNEAIRGKGSKITNFYISDRFKKG